MLFAGGRRFSSAFIMMNRVRNESSLLVHPSIILSSFRLFLLAVVLDIDEPLEIQNQFFLFL
jgi:hypothetical protein